MAHRLVTGCIVVLLALFLTTCATGPHARLFNLCFQNHKTYTHLSYVPSAKSSDSKNCVQYPSLWNQDFPIEVAAPSALYTDVLDMALQLNGEVGHQMFTVRLRRPLEGVTTFDKGTTVLFLQSQDLVSQCKERGNKECLGYCQFWRIHGNYLAVVTMYPQLINDSAQRRVIIKHELGHALGLRHSKKGLMRESVPKNSRMRYLTPEDVKILREL